MNTRWTDEIEALVDRAIGEPEGEPPGEWLREARRVLAALANAGQLLPPGAETRTERVIHTDPVEVAYDVLVDAMTPHYQDDPAGHWLSDLPPDLLAQRVAAAYGLAGLLAQPTTGADNNQEDPSSPPQSTHSHEQPPNVADRPNGPPEAHRPAEAVPHPRHTAERPTNMTNTNKREPGRPQKDTEPHTPHATND